LLVRRPMQGLTCSVMSSNVVIMMLVVTSFLFPVLVLNFLVLVMIARLFLENMYVLHVQPVVCRST